MAETFAQVISKIYSGSGGLNTGSVNPEAVLYNIGKARDLGPSPVQANLLNQAYQLTSGKDYQGAAVRIWTILGSPAGSAPATNSKIAATQAAAVKAEAANTIDPAKTAGYAFSVTMSHADQNNFINARAKNPSLTEYQYRKSKGISTAVAKGSYVAPKYTTGSGNNSGTGAAKVVSQSTGQVVRQTPTTTKGVSNALTGSQKIAAQSKVNPTTNKPKVVTPAKTTTPVKATVAKVTTPVKTTPPAIKAAVVKPTTSSLTSSTMKSGDAKIVAIKASSSINNSASAKTGTAQQAKPTIVKKAESATTRTPSSPAAIGYSVANMMSTNLQKITSTPATIESTKGVKAFKPTEQKQDSVKSKVSAAIGGVLNAWETRDYNKASNYADKQIAEERERAKQYTGIQRWLLEADADFKASMTKPAIDVKIDKANAYISKNFTSKIIPDFAKTETKEAVKSISAKVAGVEDTIATKATALRTTVSKARSARESLVEGLAGSTTNPGEAKVVKAQTVTNKLANALGVVTQETTTYVRTKPINTALVAGEIYAESALVGGAIGGLKTTGRGILGTAEKYVGTKTEGLIAKGLSKEAVNVAKVYDKGGAAAYETLAAKGAYSKLATNKLVTTVGETNIRNVSGVARGVLGTAAKSVNPAVDVAFVGSLANTVSKEATGKYIDTGISISKSGVSLERSAVGVKSVEGGANYVNLLKTGGELAIGWKAFEKGTKISESGIAKAAPNFYAAAEKGKFEYGISDALGATKKTALSATGIVRGRTVGAEPYHDKVTLRSRGDVAEKVLDADRITVVRSGMRTSYNPMTKGATISGAEGALSRAVIYEKGDLGIAKKINDYTARQKAIKDIQAGGGDKYYVDTSADPMVGTVANPAKGFYASLAHDTGVEPYSELFISNSSMINPNPKSAASRLVQKTAIKAQNLVGEKSRIGKKIGKAVDTKNIGTSYKKANRFVVVNENLRTVELPSDLKAAIKEDIKRGSITDAHKKAMYDLAYEQSGKYKEPVAIVPPKTAAGWEQAENEVFVVVHPDANKITGKQFAGYTRSGAKISKISIGEQKLTSSAVGNIAENLGYNYALGADKYGVYNKKMQTTENYNMQRRINELYGKDVVSVPRGYEEGKHGLEHVTNVEKNMLTLAKQYPHLGITEEVAHVRGQYHDVAKIGERDNPLTSHGVSAARAIRKGEIHSKDLDTLTKEQRSQTADDIAYHQVNKALSSGNLLGYMKTKVLYRPTASGKVLANADRMDLTRFNIKVDRNELFDLTKRKSVGERAKDMASRVKSDVVTSGRGISEDVTGAARMLGRDFKAGVTGKTEKTGESFAKGERRVLKSREEIREVRDPYKVLIGDSKAIKDRRLKDTKDSITIYSNKTKGAREYNYGLISSGGKLYNSTSTKNNLPDVLGDKKYDNKYEKGKRTLPDVIGGKKYDQYDNKKGKRQLPDVYKDYRNDNYDNQKGRGYIPTPNDSGYKPPYASNEVVRYPYNKSGNDYPGNYNNDYRGGSDHKGNDYTGGSGGSGGNYGGGGDSGNSGYTGDKGSGHDGSYKGTRRAPQIENMIRPQKKQKQYTAATNPLLSTDQLVSKTKVAGFRESTKSTNSMKRVPTISTRKSIANMIPKSQTRSMPLAQKKTSNSKKR